MMNDQLIRDCEQSFYKEVYHMDRPGYSIVVDETTGRVCVRKNLKIYERDVYEYLREYRNVHVPAVYSVFEHDGILTVLEELIQGIPLSDMLSESPIPDNQKKSILLQICDALNFLHNAKPPIIHRDVKAENIMITGDGRAVLIDYDAAKIYHENKTKDTILLGTEGSAAPEQYGFGQSDARTDIYGMGALIKRMFPDNQRMLRISEKAMRIDPNQRYQSVSALQRAIEACSRKAMDGRTTKEKVRMNIPGFRTGHPWKMVTAVAAYILILYIGLSLEIKNPKSMLDVWLNRIVFLVMCGNLIDLYTNWTHFFRNFPFMKSEKTAVRMIGYMLNTVLIIFFWIFILAVTETFL